ncbi:hypothetical protein [Methylobacterium sp. E-046]|uniref:hypothetical protein n=1 Tax=Methylobacterium sp. E-046 TaxID=2836576 RepID=UPI001FBABEA2|nr:hypothetical protein [Methylobacterium sp. E-046]MCJ2102450.1 hypothetical protein [Methylobacterium sp. E-046]
MSVQIKVLPVTEAEVGLVHPHDGPLAAEGSDWTHDAFTERRLQEQVIRRFEADADAGDASAEAKPAKPKSQAAA